MNFRPRASSPMVALVSLIRREYFFIHFRLCWRFVLSFREFRRGRMLLNFAFFTLCVEVLQSTSGRPRAVGFLNPRVRLALQFSNNITISSGGCHGFLLCCFANTSLLSAMAMSALHCTNVTSGAINELDAGPFARANQSCLNAEELCNVSFQSLADDACTE